MAGAGPKATGSRSSQGPPRTGQAAPGRLRFALTAGHAGFGARRAPAYVAARRRVALRDRLLASRRALRDVMGAMTVPDARGGSRAQMGQCGADRALAGLDDVSGRICPGSWHGRGERVIGGRAVTVEAVAGLCSRLPNLLDNVDNCGGPLFGPLLVDGVPGVLGNEVLAGGGLGETGLQFGPSAAHAFRQALGRAQHDDGHLWQGRGRADMADVRDRRGAQPVLVAEHPLPGYSLLCTERQHAFTYDAIFPA